MAGLALPPGRGRAVPAARAVRRQGPAAASKAARIPVDAVPHDRGQGADVDAGRLRPRARRDRARRRAAGRPHRHHLARRDGLDQPGAVGEPARAVLHGEPGGPVPRARPDVAAALGDEPEGPAHRARHRRDEPVPAAVRAGAVALAVRRAAAAGGHALRPVRVPRPRCAELCLLPGLALHRGRHAGRASRWRPRAARTSRSARR